MSAFDHTKPPFPSPPGGADDIIELTELVEEVPAEPFDEATAEVVLDFQGENGMDILKAMEEAPEEAPPPDPPGVPQEDSLDDFLASLPELPEDLDVPAAAPPPVEPAAAPLGQELAGRLSDADLVEVVRQVVQETVERLARELFPKIACEAIDRELTLLKKRLTEPD
jgi:hypothetical protein